MTPDAVLTDDQKVIRFRKTILKRRQESGSTNVGSGEEEEDDDEQTGMSINSISPTLSLPTGDDVVENLIQSVDFSRSPKISRLEELLGSLPNGVVDVKETVSKQDRGDEEHEGSMSTNDFEMSANFIDCPDPIEDEYTFKDVDCPPVKSSKNFQQKIDSILKAYHMAAVQMKSSW